ncbi:alpha/beta hydrolase [Modestobacter sp. VKM Ac-2986]|uniref:alpha/beta fold hydrolase n=1 Tax=Modestobacter sp. VKM Ac-2986 TaxID=3004140 RepID=UPI0022AAD882|nr:alpha/beta hydrolase [Modestobacter sp. VKM Ac-2986]MCZ2827885.1 alpha/beta hydrolase [Modestobacter sp. VKM Ac-2986]
MRVVFVHGACVRDGAWWWHRTAALLTERGVASVAPALPSCGETGVAGLGLDADVAAVRAVLQDGGDEPTVVVAHSYGGIVTAEAGAGVTAVQHLLLVSSYLPEVGESLSTFGGPEPAPFLDVDVEAGTFGVRPELLTETFLQDCPEVAADAGERLVRQSLSVLGTPVTTAAWAHVPTTYLVCTDDRGTPAAAQREFARRASTVVELDAGHHPFLSRPREVADLVLDLPA